MQGRIATIDRNKGFFFITVLDITPGERHADYFCHRSECRDGLSPQTAEVGDLVTFTPDPKAQRGPRALDVRAIARD